MKTLPHALSAAALLGGIIVLLVWGASPPLWLAWLEATLLMGAALFYGYFGHLPAVSRWLWSRPIRGTILVCLGLVAICVPPQLVFAAFVVGAGVRLLWQSACDLDNRDALSAGPASQGTTDLEPRGVPPYLMPRDGSPAGRVARVVVEALIPSERKPGRNGE